MGHGGAAACERHQSGNIGAPSAFDGGQTQVEHANARLCPRGCKCCSRAGRLSRTREIKGKWKRTAGSKPRSGSSRRGNNQFHISRGAITSPAPPKAAPLVPLTIARKRRRYYSRGSVTFQDKCGELMAPPPHLHPASTGPPSGSKPTLFYSYKLWERRGSVGGGTRSQHDVGGVIFKGALGSALITALRRFSLMKVIFYSFPE